MTISVCYFTSRINPRVQWFCDSLVRYAGTDLADVQVIFVDRHLWALTPSAGSLWRRGDLFDVTDPTWHVESRREVFERAVGGRFKFLHLPVKPCAHQGPFRLTTRNMFCAASARNTAIIAATGDYFVGVDDLSVLLPTWWPQVKHAASSGYSVAGAYWKQKQLVVEDGEVKSFEEYPGGRDTRWAHGSDTGIIPWQGRDVYGCSFGMPVELLVRINGFEELADGEGGEDYCMGVRSERAGARWFYNRNMISWESEEGHHEEPSLPRERKLVTPDRLPADYENYPHARPAERHNSDHVMLNRLRHEQRTTTLAQWTNIRQAREEFRASHRIMIPAEPTHDWRDGQDLRTL